MVEICTFISELVYYYVCLVVVGTREIKHKGR